MFPLFAKYDHPLTSAAHWREHIELIRAIDKENTDDKLLKVSKTMMSLCFNASNKLDELALSIMLKVILTQGYDCISFEGLELDDSFLSVLVTCPHIANVKFLCFDHNCFSEQAILKFMASVDVMKSLEGFSFEDVHATEAMSDALCDTLRANPNLQYVMFNKNSDAHLEAAMIIMEEREDQKLSVTHRR